MSSMHIREHGHDESKVQCVRFFQNVALRQNVIGVKRISTRSAAAAQDGHNFGFECVSASASMMALLPIALEPDLVLEHAHNFSTEQKGDMGRRSGR